MKKILLFLIMLFIMPSVLLASETEYQQKDGLFKISLPDGWRGQEMPGKVLVLPPPPNGGGIVIQFKVASGVETLEEVKARIGSGLESIAEYKVKSSGGSVIENKEIEIDNVYARYLYYKISLKEESMYFFRVVFVNKGYTFSFDYGNSSKEDVDKMLNVVKALKF